LQLARADAERGALDHERLLKIRDAVSEFANDLSDQETGRRRKAIQLPMQKHRRRWKALQKIRK
jgi:hypothetical protein